jgi:ribose transport system permease protein
LNALTRQVIGIPSPVGPLAMTWMLRGLALALANGTQVTGVPLTDPLIAFLGCGRILGLPMSVVLLVVVGNFLSVLKHKTPLDYRVRQIGSNPDAAAFSGIPIRQVKTLGFVLAAPMAGLSGIVALAFFTVDDPRNGGGIELFAVFGAVIGGTPLAGGQGTVFSAIIGMILLTAVAVGMVYFQIPTTWTQFATSAVILGAVSVDGLVERQHNIAARRH